MRKEYGKAVRELFGLYMAREVPDFAPGEVSSMYLFPGERPYFRKVDEHLYLWIILCPDQKGFENFTVEIGWSKLGRFPELSMRPVGGVGNGDEIYNEVEYIQRLSSCWGLEDYWWKLPRKPESIKISHAEARDLVRQRVEEAVQKVAKFAPKFFKPLLESGE